MKSLTDEEVIINRKLYGSNKIEIKNENKFISLLIRSLGDPIIKILLIALAVRLVLMFKSFDWYETLGMLISILLSSLISSLSEYGSNKSFQKLQSECEKVEVTVKRNNKLIKIKSDDVVVNDIIYVSSGESICADGIIISGSISLDESMINGETIERIATINDKVFKGSIVTTDEAVMKVTAVGLNTVYGSMVYELNEASSDSPMKIRLTKLASSISKIGIIGAILVSISYLINVIFISNNFDMEIISALLTNKEFIIDTIIHAVTLALTVIIVCVPEGLPMMIALVLSSNMKRMLKSNVLVRKPVGIETSGSLSVLLLDKTGTLTTGKLNAIGIVDAKDNHFNNIEELNGTLKEEIITAVNYNNSAIYEDNNIIGNNQTDIALLRFIGNIKKDKTIIDKVNFNSNIKYSSVTLSNHDIYYKGAIEVLLDKCIFYMDKNGKKEVINNKKDILKLVDKYTSIGIRVIALVKNKILLGFILLSDEIRDAAYFSIKQIEEAGIHTIIASGDALLTVKNIASKLNMIDESSLIIDHDTLIKMSDEEILEKYKKIKIIARALPSDKSRLASILEKNGFVVGMTGDGVNDAPALKKSSVGFSLGSGTEIAKEASDIVIIDDNISSLVNAILYGRTIFKSIRKFIIFQLTMNLCALFLSIVGPLIGNSSPVTIMQMLWINMIMDTLGGLAFSYCPPDKRYLKEVPIKKDEAILNKYMYITIILISLFESILLILFLKLPLLNSLIRSEPKYILTAFFSLFIFINVFNAFNCRTSRINILSGITKNKMFLFIFGFIFICQIFIIYYGGNLFRTFGLTIKELTFVLLLSSSVIVVDVLKKIILKKNNK